MDFYQNTAPAFLFTSLLFFTTSTTAAIIEYQFSGELYDIHENLDFVFSNGDKFSGNFSYNSESPDSNVNPQIGSYPIVSYSFEVNDITGTTDGAWFDIIDEYYVGYSQYVVWSNRIDHGLLGSGTNLSLFASGFGFYDYSGDLFIDDSLPTSVPNINDYDERSFFLLFTDSSDALNPGYWANGTITNISEIATVSEPPMLRLALFGLVLLVQSQRKKSL